MNDLRGSYYVELLSLRPSNKYQFIMSVVCLIGHYDTRVLFRRNCGGRLRPVVSLVPKISVPWHMIRIDFSGKLSGKSNRKEYCSADRASTF